MIQYLVLKKLKRSPTVNKHEMIEDIQILIKANKDNPNCSVFWLADMIKEIITNPDLKESD